MPSDPRRVVASGYDKIADIYLDRFGSSATRQKWLGHLIDGLPAGGGRRSIWAAGQASLSPASSLPSDTMSLAWMGRNNRLSELRQNVPGAAFIQSEICANNIRDRLIRCDWSLLLGHARPSEPARRVDLRHCYLAQASGISGCELWSRRGGRVDGRVAWNNDVLRSRQRSGIAETSGQFRIEAFAFLRSSSRIHEDASFLWIEAIKQA